jgi:hypothetical protein
MGQFSGKLGLRIEHRGALVAKPIMQGVRLRLVR